MNIEQITSNIKTILELDETEDTLLTVLISKAVNDVIAECNDTFDNGFPTPLESVIEDLVIYRYNRRGSEGFSNERQGEWTITHSNDIPFEILRRLFKYRKMRVL